MASPKTPRRQERIFAFRVLYSLCFLEPKKGSDLRDVFLKTPDKPQHILDTTGFAWDIVLGVTELQPKLDALLESFSENWRVERMGKIEVTLLRIALYELTCRDDIPAKVVLNEAIELSKLFGDDKARSFVNGILDAAAKSAEAGTLPTHV